MASNASSDALGFPVRGIPKTVREKNIIFNVIKYFEDEKERHGKQKFRPNAVMQKAAEATGVPLRTLQRLSNANSESKKIKCKKAKLSREKFGKLDDFDLGVIRRLIHQTTLYLLIIKDLRCSFLIFTPKNSQFLKPQNLLQLLLISICFSREIEATI